MTISSESQKLQKVLAACGLGSRRMMETWILDGRVSVNGELAILGQRVTEKDSIVVDGKPVFTPISNTSPAILMYHKPRGEVCTRDDPEKRPTVFDYLPDPPSGRWVMVGRLDVNTSGLLLFTNDGELANRLMHPSFHLEREYHVRVYGEITDDMLDRLRKGVTLQDGEAKFDKISFLKKPPVEFQGDGKARAKSSRGAYMQYVSSETSAQHSQNLKGNGREACNHWFSVTIGIGRNRIVRRLWESQGVKVNRLERVRFGPIILPQSLREGEVKNLSEVEIKNVGWTKRSVSTKAM